MKKRIILLISGIVICLGILAYFQINNKTHLRKNCLIDKNSSIAIMIKENGKNDYIKSSSSTIPIGNYVLNKDKTYCENNGKVSNYNNATGAISFALVGADKCYLYFDYKEVRVGYEAVLIDNGGSATTVDDARKYIESRTAPDFSSTPTTNEGMFYIQDDRGKSYYYRGNVDNNWVKFGHTGKCTYNDFEFDYAITDFDNGDTTGIYGEAICKQNICDIGDGYYEIGLTKSQCEDEYGATYLEQTPVWNQTSDDYYWKIVRINGDNSIRLIYSGTSAPSENEKISIKGASTGAFQSTFLPSGTINIWGFQYSTGPTYGKCTTVGADSCTINSTRVYNSEIKQSLERWYSENMTSLTNLLEDQSFCSEFGDTNASDIYFDSYYRVTGYNPSLSCSTTFNFCSDSTDKGCNGALIYPVGTLSVDEAMLAGNVQKKSNENNYLNSNINYFLSSGYAFDRSTGYSAIYIVDENGNLSSANHNFSLYVRPVISLKSNVKFIGTGTWDDPYIVIY